MASSKQKNKPKDEYKEQLKKYRNNSARHVVIFEVDMSEDEKRRVFHCAELLRQFGNELTRIMQNNLNQLLDTKEYQKLQKMYQKVLKKDDEDARKNIGAQMDVMRVKYNVTEDFLEEKRKVLYKKKNIGSDFSVSRAKDIWQGVEKVLFENGKHLNFLKRGDLPCIQAKERTRGIVIKAKDNSLDFNFNNKFHFGVKVKDRFQQDELNAIVNYLKNSNDIDHSAVKAFTENNVIVSTYRPCYASLVCERVRDKLRVFVHITVEGVAKQKFKKDGTPRHKCGKGVVGCDLGPQTVAYMSDAEAYLMNLGERGPSILENERKERELQRKMDRSRRATNQDNYNEDGTIKKGKKTWKKSNHYKKLQKEHQELQRKNALNRHYANQEIANHMRSLGDILIIEEKNAAKLAKRAKPKKVEPATANTSYSEPANQQLTNHTAKTFGEKDTKQQTNVSSSDNTQKKINTRRKRHGKSIQDRCPGFLQADLQKKFPVYIVVPKDYRASQYDHTIDKYIKKDLNVRMYELGDGTTVQRDMYSAFLMHCIDLNTLTIDKNKCKEFFEKFLKMQNETIKYIQDNHIDVKNSGIKVK